MVITRRGLFGLLGGAAAVQCVPMTVSPPSVQAPLPVAAPLVIDVSDSDEFAKALLRALREDRRGIREVISRLTP